MSTYGYYATTDIRCYSIDIRPAVVLALIGGYLKIVPPFVFYITTTLFLILLKNVHCSPTHKIWWDQWSQYIHVYMFIMIFTLSNGDGYILCIHINFTCKYIWVQKTAYSIQLYTHMSEYVNTYMYTWIHTCMHYTHWN